MTVRTRRTAVAVVAMLVAAAWTGLAACQGSGGGDGAWYRVEAPAVTLAAGASGTASVRFQPRAGYHWNGEFPARLKVSDPGTATLAKADFTNSGGDFQDQGGTGVLAIPLTAGTASQSVLKGVADFSVCNDKECRIFKQVAIEVPLHVQ